jgi:hypothetical protein
MAYLRQAEPPRRQAFLACAEKKPQGYEDFALRYNG